MSAAKRKSFLAVAGVVAVALAAELAVLVLENVNLSKQRVALEASRKQLARLNERDPYPSMENTRLMEEGLEDFKYRVMELGAELKRDPFPWDAAEAADFSARAQDVIERFRKRSERAGVALPAGLEVGFAQYASGGSVPGARFVPRLSRQLYSVERVADVLARGGVISIEGLDREIFEDVPQALAADRRRRPRREDSAAAGLGPSLFLSLIHI